MHQRLIAKPFHQPHAGGHHRVGSAVIDEGRVFGSQAKVNLGSQWQRGSRKRNGKGAAMRKRKRDQTNRLPGFFLQPASNETAMFSATVMCG